MRYGMTEAKQDLNKAREMLRREMHQLADSDARKKNAPYFGPGVLASAPRISGDL